jgi:hypothetical protein
MAATEAASSQSGDARQVRNSFRFRPRVWLQRLNEDGNRRAALVVERGVPGVVRRRLIGVMGGNELGRQSVLCRPSDATRTPIERSCRVRRTLLGGCRGLCGRFGRFWSGATLRPMRADLTGALTIGDELYVVGKNARAKVPRRVIGLSSECSVSLRFAGDADPPPHRAWGRGRRRGPAGERALAFLKFD